MSHLNPENEIPPATEIVTSVDVNVYEIRQKMDLVHIQEIANVLGRLMTDYHRTHRQMLDTHPGRTVVNGELNITIEIRSQ